MCLLEYGRKAGESDYADFDDEDGAGGSHVSMFCSHMIHFKSYSATMPETLHESLSRTCHISFR